MKRTLALYIDGDKLRCLYLKGNTVLLPLSSEGPLDKFISKVKNDSPQIVLLFPRRMLFSRRFSMPVLKKDDLEDAIYHELSRVLPYPIDDLILNWIAKRNNNMVNIESIAARRCDVENMLMALKPFDLIPDTIIPIDEGLVVGFMYETKGWVELKNETLNTPYILAGFWENKISISFVDTNQAILGREAEIETQDEAVEELIESIKYYASFTDEDDIRIYIIGENIDLSEKVKGAIGISPILVTLKDKILNSIDLALLGGALMAQRKGSVTLPLRARPRRVKKDKSLFKLTSIVAILICFFIFSKVFFNQRISYLNLKETELAQLEAKAGEVDEIKREYMDVKDKLTAIDGFLYKSTLYTRLLEELNSTLPQGTTVEVIYMEEGEIREMRGSTLSTSALISALEHSKYFLYPKLSAPISKGREGLEEFRISVRFSLEGDKDEDK
jgi:Tfp pilus assembly protein PilN